MIKNGLLDLDVQAGTSPTSVEQIRELYLKHVVTDCDLAVGLIIAKSRSPTFDN
ncbi:DegV family protein [Teredinibacter purpureus]|uniref:DegV family protein n=1 Tax=Teredinibacter purpureus TaxID=2731756 RepID=UPI000EB5ED29|nr:DegV family protein [Teredinibacter purpureus]